ncbi:MAG: thioredoxin family protein [Candidatus Eremiobacteraeota bacterium]|nr:thioredoxin family protein [Candidatus Eremiobacteraeota bacterium]
MISLLAILIGIAVAIASPAATVSEGKSVIQLPVSGNFPSLAGGLEWLNSKPLTPAELRGKVVLVDFWTYTCVNWLRTLPYVRAWNDTYRDHGLVVIGVHTPEFSFEKNVDNVKAAIKAMRVDYPVVIDSNYGIWNAFSNEYWPAEYVIDAQGRIRYSHFGEGAYQETERAIKQLLLDAGNKNVGNALVTVEPMGLEVAADWNDVRSPESYLGYRQTQGFASSGGIARDRSQTYAFPNSLQLNEWALSGQWTSGSEAVVLDKAPGKIAFRFHARDVNLIMSPPREGARVRFRVFVDGHPPADAHGGDADANGDGVVTQQRTYQLIRQQKPIRERTFTIEFFDEGAQAYDFTFG